VDKLTSLFAQVLRMPETQEFAKRQRMELMPAGQAPLRDIQREQIETWKQIAREARIELQ
jgi:tripartite-type tricarboxylate transporter receptor subunit TctC